MNREQVRRRIVEVGIVPVVRAASPKEALLGADAVCAGGVPIVEVTMTVPGALEVIAQLASRTGKDVLIGAGTVTDVETARRCLDAGAQFIVSPAFDEQTVAYVTGKSKVMMPGALTPTEVLAAWKSGADFVKVFPCGTVGGASYIKALRGPFPEIPMIPTGGVNLNTAADFLRAGAKALGIGSELVSPKALKAGDCAAITKLAQRFKEIVNETREAANAAAK